jgi:hypothetical protein
VGELSALVRDAEEAVGQLRTCLGSRGDVGQILAVTVLSIFGADALRLPLGQDAAQFVEGGAGDVAERVGGAGLVAGVVVAVGVVV